MCIFVDPPAHTSIIVPVANNGKHSCTCSKAALLIGTQGATKAPLIDLTKAAEVDDKKWEVARDHFCEACETSGSRESRCLYPRNPIKGRMSNENEIKLLAQHQRDNPVIWISQQ